MFNSLRNKGGFTLVELMITLAIASILLTVMVPGFRAFLINNRTTTQADGFISMVRTARSEAIRRSVPVRVSAINPDVSANEWGKGVRLWVDENNSGDFNATADEEEEGDIADTLIAQFDLLAGSHTLDSNSDSSELVFSPSGRSSATDRFFLCGHDNEGIGREIYVTRTGRVGIAEHNCE